MQMFAFITTMILALARGKKNVSINLSIPSRYSQTKVPTLKALQISKSLQLETHMEFEFPTAS